jgi:hypothetical protein
MRVLEGLRMHRPLRDIDQAVMLDRVLHPHFRDQVHRFIDLGGHVGEVRAEGAGFLRRAALADTEMQTAARQQVQGGDTLGHLDRVVHVEGQADHAVADMDALGRAGDEGQETLWRGHMGVAREAVMLDCPDAIEPQLFCQQRLLHHIVEHLLFALAREVHHLGFIDNREFH